MNISLFDAYPLIHRADEVGIPVVTAESGNLILNGGGSLEY